MCEGWEGKRGDLFILIGIIGQFSCILIKMLGSFTKSKFYKMK